MSKAMLLQVQIEIVFDSVFYFFESAGWEFRKHDSQIVWSFGYTAWFYRFSFLFTFLAFVKIL